MKRYTNLIAAFVILATLQSSAHAALYWDANSNLGGNGTWDVNTTQNWRTTNDVGPPDSTWTPNDGTQDAAFNGPETGAASYTVTIPEGTTINANSLAFGIPAGNVRIEGGTINIRDPNNSILMNTNFGPSTARTQIIKSAISGTDITVVPNAGGSINSFLTIGASGSGATNTFTGDLIFGGATTATGFHQIAIDNPTALPASATVRMRRGLSQLLFAGGGGGQLTPYTATFNNNIILNDVAGGPRLTSAIGAGGNVALSTTTITLGGGISGDANLIFQLGNGGGNGTIVLTNHSTYTGTTNINSNTAAVVRLGIDDALPVGNTFSVSRGTFDMAGFDQRVGGLAGGTGGSNVISNTNAATSVLTIDGSIIETYSGLIGAGALSGSNDNVALLLASTNRGTLTLDRSAGNTYSGGTTINGGRLLVSGDPGVSQTGSGPVAVNNGGTLGGSGGVGSPITVASGGHLAPGPRIGNTIGTLAALNTVSLASGSKLDIGLGAPGTSDRIDLFNFFGSFALTVPATANSVEVNLSDPAGGAAGNGTYTLMTFQAGEYTGSNNASQFFTNSLPSPNSLNGATIAYHLADDSNVIQDGNPSAATRVIMNVSGGPNALIWTGSTNGNWDTGTTANFTNAATSSSTTFAGNDNVIFDDTGTNADPVTIAAGGVQPNIVTIDNTNAIYTFSGGDIKGSSVGGGGGLVLGGMGAVTINSNYTAAGPIISNKSGTGAAIMNGVITDATSLTVNGGTLTLAGANTYAGNNTVGGGTLAVSGASATVGTGDVTVTGGTFDIAGGVANAIADTAALDISGAGKVNLGSGIDELIAALSLGGELKPGGTYGSTMSGAEFQLDQWFSGTGILTVADAGLDGDYNGDGKVDAADYVMWRKNPGAFGGDPQGYNTWRANFGEGGAGALGTGAAVPEPTTMLLVLLGMAAMLRARACRRA